MSHPVPTLADQYALFQEPHLQLRYEGESSEGVSLGITFNLEQPGEWERNDREGAENVWAGGMHLTTPRWQLLLAADDLSMQLRRFTAR